MNSLLSSIFDAHGGLRSWAGTKHITAQLSLGGTFWSARGWPGVYAKPTVTLDTQRQRIRFEPFTAAGRASVLEVGPERVTIVAADGRVVKRRVDRRQSFPRDFVDVSMPQVAIRSPTSPAPRCGTT